MSTTMMQHEDALAWAGGPIQQKDSRNRLTPCLRHRVPWLWPVLLLLGWWPVMYAMRYVWWNDPDYGGLFFVPVLATVMFSDRLEQWRKTPAAPKRWAWPLLIVVIVIAKWLMMEHPHWALVGLLLALALVIIGEYGMDHLRIALPSLGYCLLMIPPPVWLWSELILVLRYVSLESSVFFLSLANLCSADTNTFNIYLPDVDRHVLLVDACSGARSLLCLLVIGIGLLLTARLRWQIKGILILMIPIISHVLNVGRIVLTCVLHEFGWSALAQGTYHTAAGHVSFILGLAILLGAMRWLSRS